MGITLLMIMELHAAVQGDRPPHADDADDADDAGDACCEPSNIVAVKQ